MEGYLVSTQALTVQKSPKINILRLVNRLFY
jgi:hypothetical protein